MNAHFTLRAMEPEDLEILYQIENDQELWVVGTANVPYSRYALNNYVMCAANDIYADKQVRLVIENKENKVVGLLDILNFDPRHLRAEIGIVVLKEYRGRGYGDHALQRAIEYGRDFLHIHQLYAIVDVTNTASVQLFKKVGFTQTTSVKEWIFDGNDYHDAFFMQFFLQKM